MGQSASQAGAFYKQVAEIGKLWTCKDDDGIPAPLKSNGRRSMPFWSSISRIEKIIKTVPAYSDFEPHELTWQSFKEDWVPGLKKDGLLIGVNWSGKNATGYDLEPEDVVNNTEYYRNRTT